MKKNLKFILPLIVIGLIISYVIFNGINADKPKIKQIKIGVILPLTGELSSLGESAYRGAELAYQALSPENQAKIEIIYEDDQFDPKNTIASFNKLTMIDQVSAIVCFASNTCNAIAPLAEQNKIPLIAIASDPKVQENKNYVFRLEIAPAEEARLLSEYIEINNYQKIASVVAIQDGIQAGYRELKNMSYFRNHEIFTENVNPDEKDFHSVLIKLLNQKPDLIFIGLLPGMAGDLSKQATELGYHGNFIGLNFLQGPETLATAQGTLEGLVYTFAQDNQDWFNRNYLAKYNQEPGQGSAHVYDAVNLYFTSIIANKSSSDDFVNYLSTVDNFPGALGNFNSNGQHEFTLPMRLKTIKNNEYKNY